MATENTQEIANGNAQAKPQELNAQVAKMRANMQKVQVQQIRAKSMAKSQQIKLAMNRPKPRVNMPSK
jgi:hypothetical protein